MENSFSMIIFYICGLLLAFLIAYFLIIVYEELVLSKMMYISLIKKKYSKMVEMYKEINGFNQAKLEQIKAIEGLESLIKEKEIDKEKQIQEPIKRDVPQRKVLLLVN